MRVVAGPYAVAALLLIVGGALEVRRPEAASGALAGMGLTVAPIVVRIGGGLAAGVGILALVVGSGPWIRVGAILLGLAYLAFSGFVAVAFARDTPLASCGCFGRADTPPSSAHLGVNLAAVITAVAVVVSPADGFGGVVAEQPGAAIPFLFTTLVCAVLAYLVLTILPRTLAASRDARR